MDRLPKINVRHFVNKNLKPYWSPYSGYSNEYPLYIQITFSRKNTQIKSHFDNYYASTEDALKIDKELFILESDWINRIIAYEFLSQGESYKLKGFGQRYPYYSAPIPNIIDQELKKKFTESLVLTKTEFIDLLIPDKRNINIISYLKATAKLTDNKIDNYISDEFKKCIEAGGEYLERYFSDEIKPIVIDWLDGTNKAEYYEWLKYKGFDQKKINKRIGVLDQIIGPAIKFIF